MAVAPKVPKAPMAVAADETGPVATLSDDQAVSTFGAAIGDLSLRVASDANLSKARSALEVENGAGGFATHASGLARASFRDASHG